MRQGRAVIAIWNDVVPEGLAAFHAWHVAEHLAERVAIPGFLRGRRYAAADAATAPRFFTLYDVGTMAVLTGEDYTARLNAPTAATQANIPNFRGTVRALAHVAARRSEGAGGAMLTLRLEADAGAGPTLGRLLDAAMALPRMVAATLCRTDDAASGIVTREKQGKTALHAPPPWFILAEATDIEVLASVLPDDALATAGAQVVARGLYRLEQWRDGAS
jgi:hypothetical protein